MTTQKKTPTSVLPEGPGHSAFIRLGGRDLELVLTTRTTHMTRSPPRPLSCSPCPGARRLQGRDHRRFGGGHAP